MKKWIGLITAVACTCSSLAYSDDSYDNHGKVESDYDEATVMPSEEATNTNEEAPPKQVGKVSADAANAAKGSAAGKYVLAAGTVVLGITALILVSRHHGHH